MGAGLNTRAGAGLSKRLGVRPVWVRVLISVRMRVLLSRRVRDPCGAQPVWMRVLMSVRACVLKSVRVVASDDRDQTLQPFKRRIVPSSCSPSTRLPFRGHLMSDATRPGAAVAV